MSKLVSIKLTKVGPTAGPFNIYDQSENLIAENVSKKALVHGATYTVSDIVTMVRVVSVGQCTSERSSKIVNITRNDYDALQTEEQPTGCVWRHLKNPEIYNYFYGKIHPYIIEYPFAYQYHDQILQNVKDYTKTFVYTKDEYDVPNTANRVQINDVYFNKAILYNDQQCSGLLNLVPKPKHNLRNYLLYPITNSDSRTITFTKSDSWYQFNSFFDVLKNKSLPIFTRTCAPLSYDKELNQENMQYTHHSFTKAPLRAKDLRIRLILDNRSDTSLITQILFAPSQLSYK